MILYLPIKERKEVAEATLAVAFDLKGNDFPFRPGQYIQVTVPQLLHEDPKGNSRVFSIASSPNNKAQLQIATRLRGSGFKKTLQELPLGTEVEIDGPFGSFVLPQNATRPFVLVAGGIGITPFMSMIRYVTEEKLPHTLTLLYSNRTPESTAFLDDLNELKTENKNFRMIATITEPENTKAPWPGKVGLITPDFLKENMGNLLEPVWYIAGPPRMVTAIKKALTDVAVSEDDIHFEEFAGYE